MKKSQQKNEKTLSNWIKLQTPNTVPTRVFASLVTAALLMAASPSATLAAEGEAKHDAWPCVQRKVTELSPTTMWDGPAIDGINDWYKDEPIRKLIPVLVSRRIEMEEVEKAIESFAKGRPEASRDRALTVLFAGIFDNTNRRRKTIMRGIEKYQGRQATRAKSLEKKSTELSNLRRDAGTSADANKLAEQAQAKYDWDARVFQERQQNVTLACEIPVLIEQRAYALAQAIRAQMIE